MSRCETTYKVRPGCIILLIIESCNHSSRKPWVEKRPSIRAILCSSIDGYELFVAKALDRDPLTNVTVGYIRLNFEGRLVESRRREGPRDRRCRQSDQGK